MDPALAELLRGEEAAGDRVVEAIIRLHRPGPVPEVHLVARFGLIATCRLPLGAIEAVREHPNVASLKAPRGLGPEPESPAPGPAPDSPAARPLPAPLPADRRRPAGLELTGAGVVIGAVDWGMDVAHPDFLAADGSTRLLALWDQRDGSDEPPDPYGYGVVHTRERIDQALAGGRPYADLGYHPAIADRGNGSHGAHVLDIAAGNGRAGGPCGVAPEADLVFVHMADRNTGGEATLGDSVRLLEAVDFIARVAGTRPWVLNLSVGRCGGQHDGTTLVELALDELLAAAPGRFIVQSTGNYYRARTHASGTLRPGERRVLTFDVAPKDLTPNELEIWYPGDDELAVRVDPPGARGPVVPLGDQSDLVVAGRPAGRVYHRAQDPNNGDNHVDAFLLPHAGRWLLTIEARRIHSGRFHAWLERDDVCPPCQARFVTADSACTTGTIANGHLPLVVGAYDAHAPDRPPAVFSSAGPTRDGRGKPDLAAPGVRVLAARSTRAGAQDGAGELVRKSGTSMATPHVTGAVALCLQADPGLTVREIRALVLDTARPARHDAARRFGRGYLDIPRLVAAVRARRPAPDTKDSDMDSDMDAEFTAMPLALAPARAYRELLYQPAGPVAGLLDRIFEVLGRPGQRLADAPRPGDVVLTVTLGRRGGGRCAVVALPELTRRRTNCEHGAAGWYVTTNSPLRDGDGTLQVLDGARVVLPGRLLLRRKADRVNEVPAENEYPEETPVDAEAAVPPFGAKERANVRTTLSSAKLTDAVTWNSKTHPALSGVTLDEIRGALANYVDEAAVRTALGAAATADAVLTESVHQFQVKCYLDTHQHDGKAGPSTLDSLGLVERKGLNNVDRVHSGARAALKKIEARLPAGLTATNWFSRMTDPSVFGQRTNGTGLHVTLVRKLRAAERYLLTLDQFKDRTPAGLGNVLGITEPHAGARPNKPKLGMHSFGLALDISYFGNPWVHKESSWLAMRNAATLISGATLAGRSAPAHFYSLTSTRAGVRPTGEVWDLVRERSVELGEYFALETDEARLRATLETARTRGAAGVFEPGESVDRAVQRWRGKIAADRRALVNGDFGRHAPPRDGFLTHLRELVIALRDHACLAWGAVDFGAGADASGDIMHFDARTDSVFRPLLDDTGGFSPKPGRHPCLTAPAAEEDEAGCGCGSDEEEEPSDPGPWAGTPEQEDFRARVLAEHIARTTAVRGAPQRDLRADELADIPSTSRTERGKTTAVRTATATAQAAEALITAANSALQAAQQAGHADAQRTVRITAVSGYRGSDHQRQLWLGYFATKYYNKTRDARARIADGPHSDAAVDYMLRPTGSGGYGVGGRIAAPGFSNHQGGIAIDLWQERTSGNAVANDSDNPSRCRWRLTWLHGWLRRNAAAHGFQPIATEEWHWEYRPNVRATSDLTDHRGGRLWTFASATHPHPVAVFCPKAALGRADVDVLVFAHGLLGGCPGPKRFPTGFVTSAPFELGRVVDESGRPVVLVVPMLDWGNPCGAVVFGARHKDWQPLGKPAALNAVVSEVLAEVGRVQGIAAPALRQFVVAGHSRAYDVLEPLAASRTDVAMTQGALARLSEVWAFDTTYTGDVGAWTDWLRLNQSLRLRVYYRPVEKTKNAGDRFHAQRGDRLAVTRVEEKHCAVPAQRLAELLAPARPAEEEPHDAEPEAPDAEEADLDEDLSATYGLGDESPFETEDE